MRGKKFKIEIHEGMKSKCVMCGKEDRVKGKIPSGAKYLCPKCVKKVEEAMNREVS